jgi:hypothetical protein
METTSQVEARKAKAKTTWRRPVHAEIKYTSWDETGTSGDQGRAG